MENNGFSRFPKVFWEIWVSISSTPHVYCRPKSYRGSSRDGERNRRPGVQHVCPEMHKELEWPGQQEQWNLPKWRQQALQGNRVVANVYEAHEVASAALPVFAKVLNDVSQLFFLVIIPESDITE